MIEWEFTTKKLRFSVTNHIIYLEYYDNIFPKIFIIWLHRRYMEYLSSSLKTISLKQSPAPLMIGERLNAQGSLKAKHLILDQDYEGLITLAREQEGAHCLDVCVATTERDDEKDTMLKLVKKLSMDVEQPLVIDSTDPVVMEAAIRHTPGKPMINSINLEGDGSRFTDLAPVMVKYGVPAIAMCIGHEGMAKTAKDKLKIAHDIVECGSKYGIRQSQYVFDPLTFTLATGQSEFVDSAMQTLQGIELIKQKFPESCTVIGLSNISFGLEPSQRRILNSVFLYHAILSGLDCVIANPLGITPYNIIPHNIRIVAEKLIFGKVGLDKFLKTCEGLDGKSSNIKPKVDPTWSPEIRLSYKIIHQIREGVEMDVEDSIMGGGGTHNAAISVLNNTLLPAMKEVGDKFGSGEIILPHVLKSAECMKASVEKLETYLDKKDGASKGVIVLGTVYGDVHDIGKNLVKTILQNNGYKVYDLGKQVPIQKFVDKINEVNADAVGLSALLVSTSRQMKMFLEKMRELDMDIPVLCGGAAINSKYIDRIASENNYPAFYCNTMFTGLKIINSLVDDADSIITKRLGENIQCRKTCCCIQCGNSTQWHCSRQTS